MRNFLKSLMEKYIAILRGINVSGKNIIKMKDLKSELDDLGFKNVITYIQSGNIVFEHEKTPTNRLTAVIKQTIAKKFKLDVPVMVFETEQWKKILTNNAFLGEENIDITKLHVTFLSSSPSTVFIAQINLDAYLPDQLIITNEAIYLYCPNGYGKTKLTNNFFEAKLKVTATTRNWKTANKLLELSLEN